MEGKRRVAGLGPVPHPMSPLCFPGGSCCNQLAPAWASRPQMGSTWAWILGQFPPPSCLMTNPEYPSPHLIALHFIKRGVMSAQLLISKEFLPPGRASLSSASETHFFPSLINFLLLLWQSWFSISLGSTSLQNQRAFWLVGVRTFEKDPEHGSSGLGENSFGSTLYPGGCE